jgi:hypothetical protein
MPAYTHTLHVGALLLTPISSTMWRLQLRGSSSVHQQQRRKGPEQPCPNPKASSSRPLSLPSSRSSPLVPGVGAAQELVIGDDILST